MSEGVSEVSPSVRGEEIDISKLELKNSQSIFAWTQGFESFEKMPPSERAVYWTLEDGVPNNYLRAKKAAAEAGFDDKRQLWYEIKALENRMDALMLSKDERHIKEFLSLYYIKNKLKNKFDNLK